MVDENNETVENKVKFGDFPFPLMKGPKESRHLTWLRNHSNYMGARGYLDYLRAGGMLVRGILINFLILLSLLLVVSLVIGHLYRTELTGQIAGTDLSQLFWEWFNSPNWSQFWEWVKSPKMPEPFALTRSVLLFVLVGILLSPILVLFSQIAGQKKSMERAGSDSSVMRRDKFERAFGGALLLILAVALFEALPELTKQFHQFLERNTDWNAIFTSAAGVSIVTLGGASKLLSILGGAKKKLAMLLIGMLGVLPPLFVILYVTDFLVYGPSKPQLWFVLTIIPAVGLVLVLLAQILSLRA